MRSIMVFVVLSSQAWGQNDLRPLACQAESQLLSREGGSATTIEFVNSLPGVVRLYWRDASGKRQPSGTLAPGARRSQATSSLHLWIAADNAGQCLGIFEATVAAGRALLSAAALANPEHPPVIRTYAGTEWTFPSGELTAKDAPLGYPGSLLVDAAGTLYVSDAWTRRVVRIAPDGAVTTVAGNGFLSYSGDGGLATRAALQYARGLALDDTGALYIADSGNARVRRVTPDGIIRTVVGPRWVQSPCGLAYGPDRNLYVADEGKHRVIRIPPGGPPSVFAGTGEAGFSGDSQPASKAQFQRPCGVTLDAAGNLWIADSGNHRIRKIDPRGIINTVAGTGKDETSGDGGPALQAGLSEPADLAFDARTKSVYFIQSSGFVRAIRPDGRVERVAGSGFSFSGDGGPALKAEMGFTPGLAVGPKGEVFVSDASHGRVRRIVNGIINTYAGNGEFRAFPDGTPAALTSFSTPRYLAFDPQGQLVVSEAVGGRITRINADGSRINLVGTSLQSPIRNVLDFAEGQLASRETNGLRYGRSGDLFFTVADRGLVGKLSVGGSLSVVASGLDWPRDVIPEDDGNLLVLESSAHCLVRILRSGQKRVIAGKCGTAGFSGDGGPARAALLHEPRHMLADGKGNIYIADGENQRVRRIGPEGVIRTVAGTGKSGYSGDTGPATEAELSGPAGLALDAAGNLYIAEVGNNRLRCVDTKGIIRTVAGDGVARFAGDGGLARNASFERVGDVKIDARGNIYLVDGYHEGGNDRIRMIPAEQPTFTAMPAELSFAFADGAPQVQTVSLTPSLLGLPFVTTTVTADGKPWLTVEASNDTMPATLRVMVDPVKAALETGKPLSGTITVTAPGATGPQVIRVRVAGSLGSATPRMEISTRSLELKARQGSAAPPTTVEVRNAGGGTLAVTTAVPGKAAAWLSVAKAGKATSEQPARLVVTANAAGLAPGGYNAVIRVTDGNKQTIPVRVTLTVTRAPQSILLSQTGLLFQAAPGMAATAQALQVHNAGQGTLNFKATASTVTGEPWLSVSGPSTATEAQAATLQISANPGKLTPGAYYGKVTIVAEGADNSPQSAVVVLQVLPRASKVAPRVRPANLVFVAQAGNQNPSSQLIQLVNPGAGELSYASSVQAQGGGKWMKYQPADGRLGPGRQTISVQPEIAGLTPGVYQGSITLRFSDGSVRTVRTKLILTPQPPPPPPRESAWAADTCTPAELAPVLTTLGENFATPASWPVPIEVVVVDDCGSPMESGNVSVTFSNGDASLKLRSTGNGVWKATWASRRGQSRVTIEVIAENGKGLRRAERFSGELSANAMSPPSISEGGVSAGGVGAEGAVVSLGGLLHIVGEDLSAGAQETARAVQQLGGTQVFLADRVLPLVSAKPKLLKALLLLPVDMPPDRQYQLIVQRGNALSQPENVTVVSLRPAIVANDGGQPEIYVTNAAGQNVPVSEQSPARPGGKVIVYASGLGVADSTGTKDVSVKVGAAAVQATAKPARDKPGQWEISFVLPDVVEPGDQVPVVILVGEQESAEAVTVVRQ